MADRSSREPYGVSADLFQQQGLWTKLAVYRPLAVLAGIWVVLLAIALLAYGQLLHTTTDTHEVEVSASDLKAYPHQRLDEETDSPETETPSSETELSDPEAPPPSQPNEAADAALASLTDEGFSEWTLAALVSTCALGCWLISAHLKSSKRGRSKVKKGRRSTQRPGSKKILISPRSQQPVQANQPRKADSPEKLAPYDPTQPLMKSTAGAPSAASASPPESPPLPPTDVTVMSDTHQHRLDWPEDSLINTADVRQRRSLSSFL